MSLHGFAKYAGEVRVRVRVMTRFRVSVWVRVLARVRARGWVSVRNDLRVKVKVS